MANSSSDFRTQPAVAHLNPLTCKHCNRNKITVSQCWTDTTMGMEVQMIHFEQAIDGGTGRMLHRALVSTEWQHMLRKTEKEVALEKWSRARGTATFFGKGNDIIMNELFTILQCIECEGEMEVWHQIVQLDGEKNLRWILMLRKLERPEISTGEEKTDKEKAEWVVV